ncbi:unnamed protein product [Toxocara canis]|uniref:Transcriptional regulator n=1 Tax=Toxocara canis TaxID=6265 RepID=A0A183U7I0_TOXCA|nr:unnamed protein product [Toxocara canis]
MEGETRRGTDRRCVRLCRRFVAQMRLRPNALETAQQRLAVSARVLRYDQLPIGRFCAHHSILAELKRFARTELYANTERRIFLGTGIDRATCDQPFLSSLHEMNVVASIVLMVAIPIWGDYSIEQLQNERFAYTVETPDAGLTPSKARYRIDDMVFDQIPLR